MILANSTTSLSQHIFWIGSRAAGVVAIAMLTFAVMVGLAQGGRLPLGIKARDLTRVHEFTSLAAIVAIAVHGALLLADPWLAPSISQILVPFKLDYRSFYTGLGIIGGWIAVILGLSYYVRDRIGVKRWKTIHRFTIAAYALTVVHVLGAGTDAQATWLKAPLLASAGIVTVMFALRLSHPGSVKQASGSRQVSRPAPGGAPTQQSWSSRPTQRVPQTPARPARR